jgi:hypothetical protein
MPEVPVNFADIYSPQPVSYTKLVHFGLLDGGAVSGYRLTIYRIGYYGNDPYSRCLEMGSPADSSRESVAETTVAVGGDGNFFTTPPLRENKACFLALAPDHNDLRISPLVHP